MSWIQSDLQKSDPGYVPPSWSDGTDEEIIEALEQQYAGNCDLHDYWSVGDERIIHLSTMYAVNVGEWHNEQDVTFVLTHAGGKYLADGVTECAFQVDQKNCLNETGYLDSGGNNGWSQYVQRINWCNSTYKDSFRSTISSIFKQFINQTCVSGGSSLADTTDYFALRAEFEVWGSVYQVPQEGVYCDYYKTSSNKIKKVITSNSNYWLRSPYSNSYYNQLFMGSDGYSYNTSSLSSEMGIAPFGVI